ncbi:MAG: helix-turn-helix domain-containing protein [Pseudomonadota bacterium]
MIEEFNYLARVITIGAGLMLLAQIVASEARDKLKLPLIGMVIGVIAYMTNSTPLKVGMGPLDPWMNLVSLSTPFFVWLFSRNLFERDPQPRAVLIIAAALLFGWMIGNFFPWTFPAGFLIVHLGSLALIVDLVRVGVLGREDDLVEQRRLIRLWLPLLVAAQTASILIFEVAELVMDITARSVTAQLINTLIIAALTVFGGLAFLRTDPELFVETSGTSPPEPEAPTLNLTPSEAVLHEKLTAAMADGVYREPGMTIASLAAHLDTPEHRLRALINQRLGYRNFSAFLNGHRIAEAREKLVDKESVDLPVLTIAMDLGYNSLPTFNRAFRAETGTTPSEFRRLRFGDDAPAVAGETVQN